MLKKPKGNLILRWSKFTLIHQGHSLVCERIDYEYTLGCISDDSVELDSESIRE